MDDLRTLFAPGVDSDDTVHRHFTSLEDTVKHWVDVSDEADRLLTAAESAGVDDENYCVYSIICGTAAASYYGAISAVADMLGVDKKALAEIVEPYATAAGAERPPPLSDADCRQAVKAILLRREKMNAELAEFRAAILGRNESHSARRTA